MDKSEAGKGDGYRPESTSGNYRKEHERIFGVDIRIPPKDHPDYRRMIATLAETLLAIHDQEVIEHMTESRYSYKVIDFTVDKLLDALIRDWSKS